jgi:hypothetical protein
MTLRLTQLRLAAAALAIAAMSLSVSSASAFTIETLGGGSNGSSRFADPDNQNNGAQLFGPGGPTMQFGAQPNTLSPFTHVPGLPGSGFVPVQPAPRPYDLNNPNYN